MAAAAAVAQPCTRRGEGAPSRPHRSPTRSMARTGAGFSSAAARAAAKSALLGKLSSLGVGASASEEDRSEVDALARALEALNPTPSPLSSPLINGRWELCYTTSAGILGLTKPAPLRPLGPIFQTIDARTLRAENTEGAPLFNSVRATLTPESDSKVFVRFDTFRIGGLVKVKAPERATGDLDTTFLDGDLRISRGNR